MAAMLNTIVCWVLGTFIVAESIMVPNRDEMMEPALPAMLQKEVEGIHDVAVDVDQSSLMTDQKACQSNAYREKVVSVIGKFEFLIHSLDKRMRASLIFGYDWKELLYRVISVTLSALQFTVDGVLANKGQIASTSPATILADSSGACRSSFISMLEKAKAATLSSGNVQTAMKCIMDDMDKCVTTIRWLEWASTGIDNVQGVIDTFWSIKELGEATEEAEAAEHKLLTEAAASHAQVKEIGAKLEQSDIEEEQKIKNTQQAIADLKLMIDQMKTHLEGKGFVFPASPLSG
jgi:hypothetical protein